MKLVQTNIPDVVIVEPAVYEDDRGWFTETFNETRFHGALLELGLSKPRAFVQDNHSMSHRGVLRGLHFQRAPHAQGKLVRVVRGAVYDVAVDIRPGSPTFGQWVGVELSERNNRMLWIPEGFAHGFLVLSEHAEVLYKTTDYWAPQHERCISWDDARLAIAWPLQAPPVVSAKDAQGASFDTAEVFG